ncbi:MAG TPA: RNA methyltransferase [Candidatus Limnocylindrales bacterium]|jgi:RNA methyltransferase, TrmH family|nr:RNA methyltransferase [Candidatus Limnocylindrales bacterium]
MERRRISSAANPRLKAALRLRDRRDRERSGLTIVDGARETLRALAGGATPREGFVSVASCADDECRAALAQLEQAGVPVHDLGPAAFARLAYGDRLDGIIAVAEIPGHALGDLSLPPEPLIGVIEGVEKPGNLGAILRTADGAGVDAVVVADPGTDLFNPNVIRASLGTVFSVPVAVASSGDVIAWLREQGVRIIAARVQASVDYTQADYRGAVAIALGSEARGLSDPWAELAHVSVHLPMNGVADSLNVSATAAVLFYEAVRQRRAG